MTKTIFTKSYNFVKVAPSLKSYQEVKKEQRILWGNGQLQPNRPIFSKKVEIFMPLEVFSYVVTACQILLATST